MDKLEQLFLEKLKNSVKEGLAKSDIEKAIIEATLHGRSFLLVTPQDKFGMTFTHISEAQIIKNATERIANEST